jgi:hypothetical protein
VSDFTNPDDWVTVPFNRKMGWAGRAVLGELACVVDVRGRLDIGAEDPVDAIQIMTDVPVDVVALALPRLVALGKVQVTSDALLLPWFEELNGVPRPRQYWSKRFYLAVYARDGRQCRYCGSTTATLTIDHIVPRIQGGADGLDNLVVACRACNSRKGGRTPSQAGMVLL